MYATPPLPAGTASDPRAILNKRMWSAQRAVTEVSSDALLSIAQHKFTLPSTASPATARLLGTSPQLSELLTSPESSSSPPQKGQLESGTDSQHDKVSSSALPEAVCFHT
jgi:hypothetical protein